MGKWLGRLMMIFGVSALPATAAGQTPADFWNWFEANQAPYFALDPRDAATTERLFNELAAHLRRVNPELVFEFGPVIDGRREFVISADGIRSAFPAVIELVRAAPSLTQWKITAFRPRRSGVTIIEMGGIRVDPSKVLVQMAHDDGKLALRLWLPGYTEKDRQKFGMAGYLLLDEALGEYDVETKISVIDFQPLGADAPDSAVALSELGPAFDRVFTETVH